ncbi:type IV secretion system protein [Rhodanobacter sp. Col0626]|uniref:type IV secretion system protein n=1 Tax=Rhodanobacter sp. Col0626 TaxID=3415679 RepID=UPI003CEB3E04
MNLMFYVLVYDYLNDKINTFGSTLMGNVMSVVSAVALILVTIWIMVQGYRMITGQSREPMMAFVVNGARIALIVSCATTMSIFGSNLHNLFTSELPTSLNQMFTGSGQTIQQSINNNLAKTVLAMAAIDSVQAPANDVQSTSDKARAADFAIFGTASPPMAAGAMLLMYNLAIALVVGLGPLFILCLIFEKTKGLFQRWLMYGIGTLFSMAMLSFISSIVLDVTARAAAAIWATGLINTLTQSQSEGLTTQAMEQGGIGLLMTMLIISAPPMAAMFFQGTLGNFMAYSAFNGAGSRPGPQGQPPGSYGNGGHGPSQNMSANSNTGAQSGIGGFNSPRSSISHNDPRLGGVSYSAASDTMKQASGLANPPPAGR